MIKFDQSDQLWSKWSDWIKLIKGGGKLEAIQMKIFSESSMAILTSKLTIFMSKRAIFGPCWHSRDRKVIKYGEQQGHFDFQNGPEALRKSWAINSSIIHFWPLEIFRFGKSLTVPTPLPLWSNILRPAFGHGHLDQP